MDAITITWHGHSCFQLTFRGYSVVFDPYENGYVPGLSPLQLQSHMVLCSHGHRDHSAAELVFRLPKTDSPFRITTIDTYHDSERGRLRGSNTIHLLECGGMRIAHFGDLGCMLAAEQMKAIGALDVAMIPIGGYYTIGPEEAKALVDALHPNIILPMHYRSKFFGFDVLATVEDFLALTGGGVFYSENSRTVTPDSPAELSVLSYLG